MTIAFNEKILPVIREKTGFDRLEPRKRLLVGGGAAVIAGFLILQLVVFPYVSARRHLARSIAEKKSELVKIVALQKEYRRLQAIGGDVEGGNAVRDQGFSLFSFVEEQAVRADVRKEILSMRPSTTDLRNGTEESFVEIRLQKIGLGQLVSFLKLIGGSHNGVFVHDISIQDSNNNTVDVAMQIAMIRKR